MDPSASRRRFIRLVVLGAAGAPLAAGLPRSAHAADLPHLEEADTLAVALGYRHDASKVDVARYPAWKATQTCANCKHALAAQADGWLPCALFAGKSVNPRGWCSAWIAKA